MANEEHRQNLWEIRTTLERSVEGEAAQQRAAAIEEQASRLRPVLGGCLMAEELAESSILHGGQTRSVLANRPEIAGNLPIGPSMIEGETTGERCFSCGKDILDNEPASRSRMGMIHSACARADNEARRHSRKKVNAY